VIVENGETLINCLAYIDLNPVRASIVARPEDYRWNYLGYHLQTNNADGFLSTGFGLKEFGVRSEKERVRLYRKYVYEAGALVPGDKPSEILPQTHTDTHGQEEKKAQKGNFDISRVDRFRQRTRYFTDSGIIGSKEFVAGIYRQFKHLFQSRHEKKPKVVKGLDGIFSLKRLSESI
jgi:putative transposase